ncbi:MAG: M28 family peptidase [Myxococcota bacterium]
MKLRRSVIALGVVLLLMGGLAASLTRMTSMPGVSFSDAPPLLDAEGKALRMRLTLDVEELAVRIGERNVPAFPQRLDLSATYLARRLSTLGYAVTRQPYFVRDLPVANLVAERRGWSRAREIVVVGAHYDSAPGTPGADDNATGVAVALELARVFSTRAPARTVRFVFFTNEEPPYFETDAMGSEVYARALRAKGEDITAMLALETMGYFSDAARSQHYPWPFSRFYPSTGSFIAFVGDQDSRELVRECVRVFRGAATVPSEGASIPRFVEGASWSDHGSFWRAGYRAVMVTDTAPFRNPHYHQSTDLPHTLDLDRLARVTQGLVAVVEELANREASP